jgi:Replication-relaxation
MEMTLEKRDEGVRGDGAKAPATQRATSTAEDRRQRLQRRDRELLAVLGICRYLTLRQVVALGPDGSSEKGTGQRLRKLAGETKGKGSAFHPPLLRTIPYRAFSGEPLRLWGLTTAGCAVAAGELARVLKAVRTDVGAVFAEHFVFLTDLFVQLARPLLRDGTLPRALPFRWNVAEDVELPWRDWDGAGSARARVIRPDAVLEVPSSQRRFFIECEMGTNTLTPVGPDKPQSTVRKLERYDSYVSGFADVPARVSHYQRKYPDGWPCEVLFLVRSETRRDATNAALKACLQRLAGTRLVARAFTLEEAAAHCCIPSQLDAALETEPPPSLARAEMSPRFYGEREHAAVKDFVLDMTAALAEANAVLRGHGLVPIPGPASKAPMLEFLRKAQAEMQRLRGPHAAILGE